MRFWLLIAYVQMPPINAHADISSEPRGLIFGPSLYQHSCFVYGSSEGSGETHLCFCCSLMRYTCTLIYQSLITGPFAVLTEQIMLSRVGYTIELFLVRFILLYSLLVRTKYDFIHS